MSIHTKVQDEVTHYTGFREFVRNACVHGQVCGHDHVLHEIVVEMGLLLSEPLSRLFTATKITVGKNEDGFLTIELFGASGCRLGSTVLHSELPEGYPPPHIEIVATGTVSAFEQFAFELVQTYEWLEDGDLVKVTAKSARLIGMYILLGMATATSTDSILAGRLQICSESREPFVPIYCVLADKIVRNRTKIVNDALAVFTSMGDDDFHIPMMWQDGARRNAKAIYLTMLMDITSGITALLVSHAPELCN